MKVPATCLGMVQISAQHTTKRQDTLMLAFRLTLNCLKFDSHYDLAHPYTRDVQFIVLWSSIHVCPTVTDDLHSTSLNMRIAC